MRLLGRICIALGLIAACVIAGIWGGSLTRNFETSTAPIAYADFIVVMLTSVAVLMTLLAIFFAVLGFIGFGSIQNGVRQRVEELISTGFQPGNPLHEIFEREAEKAAQNSAYRGVPPLDPRDEEKNDGTN